MSRFNKDRDAASTASHSDTVGSAQGTALYKYRDFSHVIRIEVLEEDARNESPPPSANATETSIRIQKFPAKLYAILAQKEFNNIITWMPHGRSWKVLRPNVFESMVMPLFFEYSNYHSFNRLVNAWSFRRIRSGPDRGSYYHELFLRGTPHLQKYMRRLPKTHKKVPMKEHDEPDFRELDRVNPLPQLDESSAIGDTSLEPNHLRTHPQSTMNDNMSMGIGQGIGGASAFEPLDPLMGAISQRRISGCLSEGGMSFNVMNAMGSISTMPFINGGGSLNSMGGMGTSEGFSVFSGMNHMNTCSGMNAMLDSSPCGVDSGLVTPSMGDLQLRRLEQFQQFQQLQSLDGQMGSSSGNRATGQDNLLQVNVFMGSQHC